METIIDRVKHFVANHMSGFDSSHDYAHVLRVVNTALKIAAEEEIRVAKSKEVGTIPDIKYDVNLITMAGLLHDVWDRKYLPPGVDANEEITATLSNVLGMSKDMAEQVNDVVSHVSYTTEAKDPAAVVAAIKRNPELACVQDADRLDAIGAIGVGRAFTYNAVRVERIKAGATGLGRYEEGYNTMTAAMEHYEYKLLKLEGMMKTETGKAMAKIKTDRLRLMLGWWNEEMESANGPV
jgi:uncharacterized protein